MDYDPRAAQRAQRAAELASRRLDPQPRGDRHGEVKLLDETNPLFVAAEAEIAALPAHTRQLLGMATVRAFRRDDSVTIVPHG